MDLLSNALKYMYCQTVAHSMAIVFQESQNNSCLGNTSVLSVPSVHVFGHLSFLPYFYLISPCPAEPGYILLLQTV